MLKCVAVVDGKRLDFEIQPLFLGYKPLVMGICGNPQNLKDFIIHKEVAFEYLNKVSGEKVAELCLRVDKIIPVESQLLILLTGISATHTFENAGERIAFRVNQMLSRKSSSNINLTRSEYDQLKVAYSIPREIRLLQVAIGDVANEFPIDLFGFADSSHFVLSLRKEKKSSLQASSAETVEVRPVSFTRAAVMYKMGRLHSAEMGPRAVSPEPYGSTALHLSETIGDYGIHRLFLFRAGKSIQSPYPAGEQLVHVHASYANWHKRQGFPLKEIPH